MIETAELTGRTEHHVAEIFPGHYLHREVHKPYFRLLEQAAAQGIDLRMSSGYRSFERQLAIWNAKVRGERPVNDGCGRAIDLAALDELEKAFAILRWSALPGASRHHWGTDIDVWDAAAAPSGYKLQLIPGEYAPEGVFHRLGAWLDAHLVRPKSDFFRPYLSDRGGVAIEPWHLSYAPLADRYQAELNIDALRAELTGADILLKDVLLAHLDEIVRRFVRLDINMCGDKT